MFYISDDPFKSKYHSGQGQESASDHECIHDDVPKPDVVCQKLEIQTMQSPV